MEPLWGSTPLPEAPVSGLVLIHGWGMSSGVWDRFPALPGIALQRHPIDLPGHGGSVMPAPGEGGAAALDLWADTCLASAPPRAVWLGWSLGGLVALAAARRAPERIAALVLMTATPRFVRASDWPPAVAAETLSRFYEGLAADPTGTLSRFLALQVRGSDRALETLRHLRQALALRPAPEPEALAQGLELLRDGPRRGGSPNRGPDPRHSDPRDRGCRPCPLPVASAGDRGGHRRLPGGPPDPLGVRGASVHGARTVEPDPAPRVERVWTVVQPMSRVDHTGAP